MIVKKKWVWVEGSAYVCVCEGMCVWCIFLYMYVCIVSAVTYIL